MWIKIHSPEVDLSKYNKLAYDKEDTKNQQKEGWIFQCIIFDQSYQIVKILQFTVIKTRLAL